MSSSPSIKVAIADDHYILRSALRRYLETHSWIQVVGEAGDGEEAIRLVQDKAVDVLVLDLSMPVLGGLSALPRLRAARPELRVVVLTSYLSEKYAQEARDAGASAYLEKGSEAEQILHAICSVARLPAANDPLVARKN